MKNIIITSCFTFALAGASHAQEVTPFTFNIGGGFTQTIGNTGRNLDNGWNLQGGVGYNFNSHIGAMVQTDFNSMGINNNVLNNIGVPGGDVRIFSATLDPIVHLNPHGHIDFYIIGGGGLYHRYQEFTAPTVETVTGFDPFLGFYNAGVPATQILASSSVNKPGANIGAGVAFGSKWRAKLYAEARYNHIFMSNGQRTDYVPVTFGVRW
jgi:opacity protein-like surface antigen